MPSKEEEILEKQRKIAERLKKKSKPPPPTGPPPQSKQIVIDLTGNDDGKANNQSQQLKRPSRPGLKRPSTGKAAFVLAAARAKAAADRKNSSTALSSKKSSTASSSTKSLASTASIPRIAQANTKSLISSSSTTTLKSPKLSNLVENATSHNSKYDDALTNSSYASNTSPEDYFQNLREWDFVGDLARQQDSSSSRADETVVTKKKPIPDTFISIRHYVAAWAPGVLSETRAQILSEVVTEYGNNHYRSSAKSPFVLVNVETTWKSSRGKDRNLHADLTDMNACHVQLKTRERNDLQFYNHDICALVPVSSKDIVEKLLRGGKVKELESSFSKSAMIGHAETNRRELNGLILKVSKRKWAQIGAKEMLVLKVGSNITALREFTALCKVQSIPLKKYLLGQHLGSNTTTTKKKTKIKDEMSQNHKAALLKEMGGVQALGEGFSKYVQKKFNPSQLRAIAAASRGYGDGGFTLIKGPPGTGKTTMLVAVLNSLHIRQYNKYYEEVRRIASMQSGNRQAALETARKAKPRLLVCAPSNAAVDNIIQKIMEDGFVDGSGQRYNPSMIRVGVGASSVVSGVTLQTKVDKILSDADPGELDTSIAGFRMELQRISGDIVKCRRRCHAIENASPWPLSKDWEIRIEEESFDTSGRVYFVNHREQTTSYECPPPPEPGETQYPARAMPEYRAFMSRTVKLVENYFSVKSNLERSTIIKASMESGANQYDVRSALESHVLNSVHMVMTTLGTAGNRILETADKFEVVVVDEAAQSVEPSILSALQLGSRQCVLVGDPQQLPATIFNVSGRNSKYDRSLFQRLEEAGQDVFMLNEQYRMHPQISHFPRHIFYKAQLQDGPNVKESKYGNPLIKLVKSRVPTLQPFTVLDLDSKEERGGKSLANSFEAHLVVHLYSYLKNITNFKDLGRVAVITPYSQQASLLRKQFNNLLGGNYSRFVEVNTVDAFQGREANIVIFSAVRAAGSHGIGFLSDVRRMNVALTRAKHFLFVIARCKSIVVNPYWKDLVQHARETDAVIRVPIISGEGYGQTPKFGNVQEWQLETPRKLEKVQVETKLESKDQGNKTSSTQPKDLRKKTNASQPSDPRKRNRDSSSKSKPEPTDPRKKKSKMESSNRTHPKPADPRKREKATSQVRPTDPRIKDTKPKDPRKNRSK